MNNIWVCALPSFLAEGPPSKLPLEEPAGPKGLRISFLTRSAIFLLFHLQVLSLSLPYARAQFWLSPASSMSQLLSSYDKISRGHSGSSRPRLGGDSSCLSQAKPDSPVAAVLPKRLSSWLDCKLAPISGPLGAASCCPPILFCCSGLIACPHSRSSESPSISTRSSAVASSVHACPNLATLEIGFARHLWPWLTGASYLLSNGQKIHRAGRKHSPSTGQASRQTKCMQEVANLQQAA